MNDCPAHASDYANGSLYCHLSENHTGRHWDRNARVWWTVQIDHDFDD